MIKTQQTSIIDRHAHVLCVFQIMNSNDLVKDILKRDIDQQDQILKSTEVIKACPVNVDLGNLLVWDPNVIDQPAYKSDRLFTPRSIHL